MSSQDKHLSRTRVFGVWLEQEGDHQQRQKEDGDSSEHLIALYYPDRYQCNHERHSKDNEEYQANHDELHKPVQINDESFLLTHLERKLVFH